MRIGAKLAIIFDMDGLMLETETVYRMASQRAAEDFGYHLCDDDYLQFVGRRVTDSTAPLLRLFGNDFPVAPFFKRSLTLFEEYVIQYGVTPKPGLNDLLDHLDILGLRKTIATSSEKDLALKCLGNLARRFESIVTGNDVHQGKPDPEIYLLTARCLDLPPDQCLVLEDSDIGVQAAYAARIPVIIVPDLKQPSPLALSQAICVCKSLYEVKDILMCMKKHG